MYKTKTFSQLIPTSGHNSVGSLSFGPVMRSLLTLWTAGTWTWPLMHESSVDPNHRGSMALHYTVISFVILIFLAKVMML